MTRETLAALGLAAFVLTLGVLLANYRIEVVINAATGIDIPITETGKFK